MTPPARNRKAKNSEFGIGRGYGRSKWKPPKSIEKIRKFLQDMDLPSGDPYDLPTSEARFPDGAHFRIEVPTVNNLETAKTLLSESEKLGTRINRITETYGIFRHTQKEIRSFVELCHGYGCELVMSPGPRAVYDTSASAQTKEGKRIGYRLRGQEQLIRAIEDIYRGIELGVTRFLIYDEGMLWVLGKMRKTNKIPSHIRFKVSAHCGHGNPAAFKLLESIGANSINPVRDLQLPMIASLRQSINVPIDCHTDCPPSSGGFIRTYESPEIVRIASPVYLKTGNSVLPHHGKMTSAVDGRAMARQSSIILEMVERYFPEAMQSSKQH